MRRVESELRMDAMRPLRIGASPHRATASSATAERGVIAPLQSSSTVTVSTSGGGGGVVPQDAQEEAGASAAAHRVSGGTPSISNSSLANVDVVASHGESDTVLRALSPPLASPTEAAVVPTSGSGTTTAQPAVPPGAGPAQQASPGRRRSGPGVDQSCPPQSPMGNADERTFEEILDAEVAVSMGKLREAARSLGVPHSLRATVYRHLLGVASIDKSSEMTSERVQEKDVEMLLSGFQRLWGQGIMAVTTGRFTQDDRSREDGGKNVSGRAEGTEPGRGTFTRHYYGLSLWPTGAGSNTLIRADESPWANGARTSAPGTIDSFAAWSAEMASLQRLEAFRQDPARREKMETTMSALYMTHADLSPEEIHYLVRLAIPFESVCHSGRDVFFCTYTMFAVQKMIGNVLHDDDCLQHHCGQFLMLLRDTNLTLYNHFYAQGISTWEWVPSLLIMLLADRHMHPHDLLRLWDSYLSEVWESMGFPLHPFVCLAVLAELTEELVECEKEEVLFRLEHFPRLHIPGILQRALATRESVLSRGLL